MLKEWPEYPEATALLSNNLTTVKGNSTVRCKLWQDNGFYAYAWTN